MDDFFQNGLIAAFLIGIVKVIISTSILLSMRARNMQKIGKYYSCNGGTFVTKKPGTSNFVFYLISVLLVGPIFNWLTVFSTAWGVIGWFTSRTSIPESIKTIQYKLAHFDLSQEQILALHQELSAILGCPSPIFTDQTEGDKYDYNENDINSNTLILGSGEWHSDVTVNNQNRTLTFYSRTPDYDNISHATFEYKFEGDQLLAKLINDSSDSYGKVNWSVRDSVILEADIRKKAAASNFRIHSVEEELASYTKAIQWHVFDSYDVRFFVMSKCPDLFSQKELRRLIRTELERLKMSVQHVITEAKKLDVEIITTEDGIDFRHPEENTEDSKARVKQFFSETSLKSLGTSMGELGISNKKQSDLLKLLGESKAA